MSKQQLELVKRLAHQLVADVVASMIQGHSVVKLKPSSCPHSVTLLRVVHELSSKHEIVFESIARKLQVQVNGHCDVEVCRRTFVGVVDELFADGRYNWGRVVTVFAYAGWLARGCKSGSDISSWSDTVTEVAGEYIGNKLSPWICQQGGWVSHLLIADMNKQLTLLLQCFAGMENIRYFRKYRIFWIFSIYIGYFRYFHFTALDWMMSTERLVFKLFISEWGYLVYVKPLSGVG